MINKRTIFEIHRLKDLGWTNRKIARKLRLSRDTTKKYLKHPEQVHKWPARASKLDPYRDLIEQFLDEDPEVKAPVVLQRLEQNGFDGKVTIVRDHLQKIRSRSKLREPFIRVESPPGKQIQIDWGHFGTLSYGETKRKLYALAATESYSRILYVEFTHSQNQDALHQGLLNAFRFFGGSPDEIVVDNMLTAVIERDGSLIRFNEAFLDFLRVFKITPRACNVRAPHEKGKVENCIKYLRQNFWPLRAFTDLEDVQSQVIKWLDTIANVRIHQTTGQQPKDRFSKVHMRPLPQLLPDFRQTAQLLVHKDFAIRFDANAYSTPPWTVGKKVIVKANNRTVTIYYQLKKLATHPRCWSRNCRIETPSHREQVKKLRKQLWQSKHVAVFSSLGPEAVTYLQALVEANQPVKKNISRLLALKDEYGVVSLIHAIKKAMAHKAYGADYIENILYQEMTPQNHHQPVKLKDENLNRIRLPEPSLADYDSFIIKRRRDDD